MNTSTEKNITLMSFPGIMFSQKELCDFQSFNGWHFTFAGKESNCVFDSSIHEYDIVKREFERFNQFIGPKKRHVHYELIRQWANDQTLVFQYWSKVANEWQDTAGQPYWEKDVKYRIKPIKKYVAEVGDRVQFEYDAPIGIQQFFIMAKKEAELFSGQSFNDEYAFVGIRSHNHIFAMNCKNLHLSLKFSKRDWSKDRWVDESEVDWSLINPSYK